MITATNHPIHRFYMCGQHMRFLFLLWCALCVFAFPANSQILQEETLSGPDSHETGQGRAWTSLRKLERRGGRAC